MKSKIYLASSWRNPRQPSIVKLLRNAGHEVYDFRNPPSGSGGFKWDQIDPDWVRWTAATWTNNLESSYVARNGFYEDLSGMKWADTCVLLLPCGRSAHLEAGWFAGQGKRLITYVPEGEGPDLMYKLADCLVLSDDQLLEAL